MAYPSDWPDICPPTDAADCAGPVYHILKANPPGPDDLKSFAEKGRTIKGGRPVARACPTACRSSATATTPCGWRGPFLPWGGIWRAGS